MFNKKISKIVTIITGIMLFSAFISCDNGNDTANHTHDWSNWETAEPTCTTDGHEIRTCLLDPLHIEIRNVKPALGHDVGNWVITQFPTATENGIESGTCSRCVETITRHLLLATFQTYFYDTWKRSDNSQIWEITDTQIKVTDHNNTVLFTRTINNWVFINSTGDGSSLYPVGFTAYPDDDSSAINFLMNVTDHDKIIPYGTNGITNIPDVGLNPLLRQ